MALALLVLLAAALALALLVVLAQCDHRSAADIASAVGRGPGGW